MKNLDQRVKALERERGANPANIELVFVNEGDSFEQAQADLATSPKRIMMIQFVRPPAQKEDQPSPL